MSGRGREAHPKVREGSVGPLRVPGRVERTTQRFGRVQVALSVVQEESGDQPGGLGGVGRTTRRSGRGWEALPVVLEG